MKLITFLKYMFKFALKKHHFKPYFQKNVRPRWCLGPVDLESVLEKINKRDELVFNVLYAVMFLLKC